MQKFLTVPPQLGNKYYIWLIFQRVRRVLGQLKIELAWKLKFIFHAKPKQFIKITHCFYWAKHQLILEKAGAPVVYFNCLNT